MNMRSKGFHRSHYILRTTKFLHEHGISLSKQRPSTGQWQRIQPARARLFSIFLVYKSQDFPSKIPLGESRKEILAQKSWKNWLTRNSKYVITLTSREKIKGNPPPVGLEPTTFELEVQHASPLRHGGFR